jgi:hypothetical protein
MYLILLQVLGTFCPQVTAETDSSTQPKDKMSELAEKNRALTEWRRQLVEKNQNLVSTV